MPLIKEALKEGAAQTKKKWNLLEEDQTNEKPLEAPGKPFEKKSYRPWDLPNLEVSDPSAAPLNQPPPSSYAKPDTNRAQSGDTTEHKPSTNRTHNRAQTEHKLETVSSEVSISEHKPDTQPSTRSNTNRAQTEHKPDTNVKVSELIGLQRTLLNFIYECCKISPEKKSGLLTLEHISQSTGVNISSIKTTLRRLEEKGAINPVSFKNGRGGAREYSIPGEVLRELVKIETDHKLNTNRAQTGHKPDTQPDTQPSTRLPSSSSLLNTTTTEGEGALFRKFQDHCELLGLTEHKINSNDLMQFWRKGIFREEKSFLDSVEHLAFYLKSPEARKIQDPKAWFCKTLGQGYYAPPIGFQSWEERQKEAETRAVIEKAERMRKLEKQRRDAEFEVWLLETPLEERRAMLAGSICQDSPDSLSAKNLLKQHFFKNYPEQLDENAKIG